MSTEKRCTRCGFTCDEADTPLYFNKRYKGARGTWESHCKACRNAQRADREARKRKDPAHIAAKNQRNRESYQRRGDPLSVDGARAQGGGAVSKRVAGRTAKRCPRCGVTYKHPERHFHKASDRGDGLSAICKDCKRMACNARYNAHKHDPAFIERRREQKRKHDAKRRGVPYIPHSEVVQTADTRTAEMGPEWRQYELPFDNDMRENMATLAQALAVTDWALCNVNRLIEPARAVKANPNAARLVRFHAALRIVRAEVERETRIDKGA